MTTFAFNAILKDHKGGLRETADRLYALYEDITVSALEGVICVSFQLEASSFSMAVQVAQQRLNTAGYEIGKIEIDGQDLPMISGDDDGFYASPLDDTRED